MLGLTLRYIDRSTQATGILGLVEARAKSFSTGSSVGDSGLPANTPLAACLLRSGSVQRALHAGTSTRDGAALRGSLEPVSLELLRRPSGHDVLSDLVGKEVRGQEAVLWETGNLEGTTYTLASPYVWRRGTVDLWDFGTERVRLTIRAPAPPLAEYALTRYEGWGLGLLYNGTSSTVRWETWDPSGDWTISVLHMLPVERWNSSSTTTLMTNGDITLERVDREYRATVAHATTDAQVSSGDVARPEAYYMVRMKYTSSTSTLELFLDGVSRGTSAGTGAVTQSANAWAFGSNQAQSGAFDKGIAGEYRFFDGTVADATLDFQERGPLAFDADDLYAYLPGVRNIAGTSLLDFAQVNTASPKAGTITLCIPATLSGGNVDDPDAEEVGPGGATGTHKGWPLGLAQHVLCRQIDGETRTRLYDGHDETDYDGTGSNGTFTAGSGYSVSDVATMSNGAQVTFDAVGGSGDVTAFTVDGTTQTSDAISGSALTQSSVSPAGGTGFTLTPGDANVHGFGGVFQCCDPLRGLQDFRRVHEGGVELNITHVVTSWIALYGVSLAAAGDAAVYPQGGAVVPHSTTVGNITADVAGGGPHVRGMYFDGVDDYVDFGTSPNSVTGAGSYSVLLVVDCASGATGDLIDSDDGSAGISIVTGLNTATGATEITFAPQVSAGGIQTLRWSAPPSQRLTGTFLWTVEDGSQILYRDGVQVDSGDDGIRSGTSTQALNIGRDSSAANQYWKGYVSELAILSEIKTLAWHIRHLHTPLITRLDEDGVAVDEGSGIVSLPAAGHPYIVGESVEISGTTNYDTSSVTLVADPKGGDGLDRIYFADTFVSETFDGYSESVKDATLEHAYPGTTHRYNASTLHDEGTATAADGTITGAAWRGGVTPTSPRSLAVYLMKAGGHDPKQLDLTGTSEWPDHPMDWTGKR